MAESLKYFRQKKGTWIWIYDCETNRRKKERKDGRRKGQMILEKGKGNRTLPGTEN